SVTGSPHRRARTEVHPMADIDYSKLSRQQKLAIFLIVVGPDAAAEVLKHLDDATIELLCREMSTFPMVSDTVQKLVVEEFSGIVAQSVNSAMGGLSYAQRTLEIAKGDYKA